MSAAWHVLAPPISAPFWLHPFLLSRRVFEQLAEEYENEKQKTASGAIEEEQSDHLPPDLHASYDSACGINGYNINDNGSEPLKFSTDLQPTWDDSDLRSETYTLPSDDQGSHAIPWQTRHSPSKELTNLSNSVNALDNTKNGKALITWSSFDDRIQEAELEESNDSLTEKKDKAREQMQRSWRTGRNSFQVCVSCVNYATTVSLINFPLR